MVKVVKRRNVTKFVESPTPISIRKDTIWTDHREWRRKQKWKFLAKVTASNDDIEDIDTDSD